MTDSPGKWTSGRAEFTRIYLGSLTASAEREAAARRARNQRLRLSLVLRRAERIKRVSAARGFAVTDAVPRPRPRFAFAVSTLALVCSTVLLIATISARGLTGVLPQLEEIAFLALALIWFGLAVACAPTLSEA